MHWLIPICLSNGLVRALLEVVASFCGLLDSLKLMIGFIEMLDKITNSTVKPGGIHG
jgi:hypothetical protein